MPSGPGFDVVSLATDGTRLFAGGSYYFDGTDVVSPGGVAVWDGDTWTTLADGLDVGTEITSMQVVDGTLYAFGFAYRQPFSPSTRDCLALSWNGDVGSPAWSTIGDFLAPDCMINATATPPTAPVRKPSQSDPE